MAARAGLTREGVVSEAVAMLDEGQRLSEVSLGALARRLGIRPQSLYAHVDGTEGLARAVAIAGLHALGAEVTDASIGAGGEAAVAAIAAAHLDFARRRPTLYEAALRPPGDDPELLAAQHRAGGALERVLVGMGLDADDRIHWTRLFLASVYGFVVLHRAGRFTLPVDTAATETRLVEMLTHQLAALSV